MINMNTSIKIEILNPKAVKLLRDLADQKLISIRQDSRSGFSGVLKKLRSNSDSVPTLDEITAEVEKVRNERYGK